ncbi:MAG: hypothetical protein R3F39_18470 [Myxococcota bacterium]
MALGLGHAVQAPTGAIYSLTTTPQEIMRFLGQLTSDGDILSLATWDLAGACINPRLDPSRAVFCDEVQPGEGLIRLMKRTEFAPLPNCLL